jgi:hypothetical protein
MPATIRRVAQQFGAGDISRRDAIITPRDTTPKNERIERYCTSDAYTRLLMVLMTGLLAVMSISKGSLSVITYLN